MFSCSFIPIAGLQPGAFHSCERMWRMANLQMKGMINDFHGSSGSCGFLNKAYQLK
jgi:hypothetical protein